MQNKFNFAFFGTSRFSVFVLESLKMRGIVPSRIITQPDRPVGRKAIQTPPPVKIWAMSHSIPVYQPVSSREVGFADELKALNLDLCLVASYGGILPDEVLSIPRHGTLNIHPSLLPKYRGATPIQSAIIHGDTQTGVTIIALDKEMDHGPIVAMKSIQLNSNETYLDLEESLATLGGELFCEHLDEWLENMTSTPQKHEDATYTRKIETEDGYIGAEVILNHPTAEELNLAERKVRAYNPEPGTFTYVNVGSRKTRVKILEATVADGKLKPLRVVPEGKSEMSYDAFLRGNAISLPQ